MKTERSLPRKLVEVLTSGVRNHPWAAWMIFLAALTAGAYWCVKANDFVNFDDNIYITENAVLQRGFTLDGVKWAFSLSGDVSYWHPLTWLSLMLDHALFGLDPAGYHLVNLLLHCINSVLLFLLLVRTTERLWESAFGSALFAIHPINVESVAWAVERKTVLGTFFFLLALLTYVRYVRRPRVSTYLLVAVTFALGLMTKASIAPLPFVLLLLDYWPLRRMRFGGGDGLASVARSMLEKVPLLLLSATGVVLSAISLSGFVATDDSSIGVRCANAVFSYAAYLGKLAWPSGLAPYYPARFSYPAWQIGVALLLLGLITTAVVRSTRRRAWLLFGWLWYLGTLFPAIGLVRNGLWPEMADRFVYVPAIGLFVIVAWGGAELATRLGFGKAAAFAAGAIVLSLAVGTRIQAGKWRDTISLLEQELKAVSGPVPYRALGLEYLRAGRRDRGAELLRREWELNRASRALDLVRGRDLLDEGEPARAISRFESALAEDEQSIDARYLLGLAFESSGNRTSAIFNYNEVLRSVQHVPAYKDAARLRIAALMTGAAPAIEAMKRDATADPRDGSTSFKLAVTLQGLGFYEEALKYYLEARRRGIDTWVLSFDMGSVLVRLKDYSGAAREYEKVLLEKPCFGEALNSLGLALRDAKRYDRAVEAFKRALACDERHSFAALNLAVTYLMSGERENAARCFEYTERNFPELAGQVGPIMARLSFKAIIW